MARIAEAELERLRKEVSVLRLVEAAGITLEQRGKDHAGRCPFHEDATASFIVSPAKNLWHCFGCGAGGGPIDWVMRREKLSFRHAAETLRAEAGLAVAAPVLRASSSADAEPADGEPAEAERQALLRQVLDYYHVSLKQRPEALAYLAKRGLNNPALIERFRLGYANRTLGYNLPSKEVKAGAEIRGRLTRIGLYRESGHEHFSGSLVVPVIDAEGLVTEIYGRKIGDALRAGTAYHLYLPGPHRGVWNEAGLAEGKGEAILCEALIDAMSFWVQGHPNVTSSYGVNGFTPDHLAAFRRHGISRVFIAYDRDEAGERAAAALAQHLISEGFEVLQLVFPMGRDANEYACGGGSLAQLLRQARWVGRGQGSGISNQKDAVLVTPEPAVPDEMAASGEGAMPEPALAEAPADKSADRPSSLAAELPTDVPAEPPAADLPPADLPADELPADLPDELVIETGTCRWRVRGWKKNPSPEAMRVTLQVRPRQTADGYHVDTLDLYAARSRAAFLRQAVAELGMAEENLKRELGSVLLRLEAAQDAWLSQQRSGPAAPAAAAMSAAEQAQALAFLKSPDLAGRIVADLQALGMVGEDLNLLAAYLAGVSRKLEAPLAVMIQSSSAAGKSSLMDAVLDLIPEEDRIRYSAMTGQSLFYLGETNLQHKVLAIAEEEGVRQAAYALKLLQSDGELTIASTGKDEATGNLVTKQYRVKGPVQLMLTTTAIDIDEELLNRCLVLSVNESREQTAAIHARQRRRQTLAGLLEQAARSDIERLHHNAQRLLSPVAVVNPYAERLTFRADRTRSRRDHMKYLGLIRTIALLHQHQRPVRQLRHDGRELSYIEVTRADIALANRIAHEVLGRMLDELPPQTRNLLRLIRTMVQERTAAASVPAGEVLFTRRDIRDATSWSDSQLKLHCARLAELEYLAVQGGCRGQVLRYTLAWNGGGEDGTRHLCGLIDPDDLPDPAPGYGYDGEKSGLEMAKSGSGRGRVWAKSTPGQTGNLDADQWVDTKPVVNGSHAYIPAGSDLPTSYPVLLTSDL